MKGPIMENEIEILAEQRNMTHQEDTGHTKGGLITTPFIIGNAAFERLASCGISPNMILYLMNEYNMRLAKGTNIIFIWSAATNFMPLLGAFLSDSYLGSFLTISLGSISSLLGMILLCLTTIVPQAQPSHCKQSPGFCKSPSIGQLSVLFLSFALISLGAGGIRSCTIAFGAHQLYKKNNPKRTKKVLESFFGWYYALMAISVVVAYTCIIYIQDHLGWNVGFGVPAVVMFFSTVLFLLASPLYVKQTVNKSLLTGFAQVIVAAFRNRRLAFPSQDSSNEWYLCKKCSNLLAPSDKLRFLNKACIVSNQEDVNPDGIASNPWSLCNIEQVEELKALIKVIPLWSTCIMMSIDISQNSFQLLQASSMDRHISPTLEIPAGSFGMFAIIALIVWVVLYDRVILPLATKIRGRPTRLGAKLRMGVGLFFSCMAMVVSAIVEDIRRKRAITEGYLNNAHGIVQMSAMWLVPQYCLSGLGEAFNAIGQTEFYYSEFPKSMSSIASSLFGLGFSVANLLASLILTVVDNFTSRQGKESWASDNINKGHYDKYYWLLAVMSFVNLGYFLLCSWAYGPCGDKRMKVQVRDETMTRDGELPCK